MQEFKVNKSAIGTRADVFISAKYPQFARSVLKNLFDSRKVHINHKAAKAGYRLKSGDRVSIDDQTLSVRPRSIDLPIVYEDKDVLVINKPAGILTHSKGALNLEPTVASFLQNKLNDKELKGNRAGIVHRLDRGTSGVIITAKNQKSLSWLQKQFSARKVKKTYLSIVEGVPTPEEAIIDIPVGRNPKRPQSFRATPLGKPAKTEFRVVREFSNNGKSYSLVELKPLTGRTHQIRVHLAYIGHPVAGDPLYGRRSGELLLHAYKLQLFLPDGKEELFSAPIPKNFKSFENA